MESRWLVVVGALAACSSAQSTATTPPPGGEATASATKPSAPIAARKDDASVVFTGRGGVRIEALPVKGGDLPARAFLLRFQNTSDELDGLVLAHEFRTNASPNNPDGPASGFHVELHGAPRLSIYFTSLTKHWGYGGLRVERKETALDGAGIIAAFEEQQRSGRHRSLLATTRAEREAHLSATFKKLAEPVTKHCGIEPTIDWTGLDDEALRAFDVAEACKQVVDPLSWMCATYPPHAKTLASSGGISCRPRPPWSGQAELAFAAGNGLSFSPGNTERSVLFDQLRAIFGELREVLRLGNRYIVIDQLRRRRGAVFSGTSKRFHRQRVKGKSSGPSNHVMVETYYLWAGGTRAELQGRGDSWTLRCGRTRHPLIHVGGSDRDALLRGVGGAEQPWHRVPYYLGRDPSGVYYYVDRVVDELGGKRHRVFIGKAGSMKRSKLLRIVNDPGGTVFATKQGQLRLTVDEGHPRVGTWSKGTAVLELKSLQVNFVGTERLIYDKLGVYLGVEIGHICEGL